MNQKQFVCILFVLAAVMLAVNGPSGPVQCTSIAVPESGPFPLIHGDIRVDVPAGVVQVTTQMVELPEGFVPVGGGDGRVIACRQ